MTSEPREDLAERAQETLARLQRIEEIPSLPAVLVQIWDLTSTENASARDLGRTLGSDPGLTGSVLRLANSAYFGFPRKVATVTQAVVVLGFETVRNLATGASVLQALRRDGGDLDADRFFDHGLATAIAARLILERRVPHKAQTAFCGGVLHDLGKLVLAEFLPESWREMQESLRDGVPYDDAERAALGLTHAEIGQWFADRWSFPEELAAAVRWHHAPQEAPAAADCVAAVHLGDIVAHRCGAGGSGRREAPAPCPSALERMRLDDEMLDGVAKTVAGSLAGHGATGSRLGVT